MKTTKAFMPKTFLLFAVLLIAGSISAYAGGELEGALQQVIDVIEDQASTARLPSAPTGVTAVRNPAGSTNVLVSWNAVSGATSYNIYFSQTNSGNGTLDGRSTTTAFTGEDYRTNRTYYFRVSAVNSAGEGTPSSWVELGPGSGTASGGGTPAPTPAPASSGGPTRWRAVSNSRFGSSMNDINDIAYGNGRFVAVGEQGKIAYSADGASWTAVSNSRFGDSTIRAIVWGGNRFVAVGDGNKIAYSADGVTWTAARNSPFNDRIYDIAWGGNRFVAVTEDGMAYSADGATWTRVTNSPAEEILTIAYGGGRFVAMGYDSSYDNIFLYSTDGARWTAVPNNVVDFDMTGVGIAYGNNRFIAGGWSGQMAYSADGVRWTAIANHPNCAAINGFAYGINAEGNGRWVAVGWGAEGFEFGGAMAYSTDGSRWTPITDSPFNASFSSVRAVAYANGRFVAVGANGKIAYADW